LLAIYIIEDGTGTLHYAHKDYLGSLYALTDETGNIATLNGQQQIFSFGPWGRRRNPTTWTFYSVPTEYLTDRGFTGHEHLKWFGLINMNGRMYDPLLGRMLSPDNYVQAPDNSQNFNRYSYAFNNPLVYTDPDGELAWFVPAIIGAVIGGGQAYFQGQNAGLTGSDLALVTAKGAISGGISSAMGAWAGGGGAISILQGDGALNGFVNGATAGGLSGAISGYAMTGTLDGTWKGMKTGALYGGIAGGITSGVNAYTNYRNVWTGENVKIGRTRFSFNNTQAPLDELYYVSSEGHLIHITQFNSPRSRRINVRFWNDDGTCSRYTHDLDLTEGTAYS
jgi:RHS repeat-associated protein